MPELPEVETVRRGIAPHISGRTIKRAVVRERRLRRPVTNQLDRLVRGRRIQAVGRRAKYLVLRTDGGHLLVHLGMSGSLRVLTRDTPPGAHDHVDLCLSGGVRLRFRDPRRFGTVLWTGAEPERHPLLRGLGPEPLSDDLEPGHLHRISRGRSAPVRNFLLDGRVVAGVGNIYACEALFRAGIAPHRKAGTISAARYRRLTGEIKATLAEAIAAGGSTLRDFVNASGEAGYFTMQLQVYGREGEPCRRCRRPLRRITLGQRSAFYCTHCQR